MDTTSNYPRGKYLFYLFIYIGKHSYEIHGTDKFEERIYY